MLTDVDFGARRSRTAPSANSSPRAAASQMRDLYGLGRRPPCLSASADGPQRRRIRRRTLLLSSDSVQKADSISTARPSARPTCFLEKMQIVEINLKDFKDTVVLMLEHPLSNEQQGQKSIDVDYIIDMMRQDWGFYYTFTTNLKRVPEHSRRVFIDPRGATRCDSRPHHQTARGHRSGAEDVGLEDALENRNVEPLVPGSLGEVRTILRESLHHADGLLGGASHPSRFPAEEIGRAGKSQL